MEEWLYKRDFRNKKTAKYKSLFERTGNQIECSPQLKEAKSLVLIAIPFYEESSGTQKIFALYGFFKHSIELGMPIFIDELDAKLHPLLMQYILGMFHSEKTNKNGAQLIYTSHDDYTLNKDIFRRDEIWFVEKDINSVSTLYSLSEYKIGDKKVRNDASYNKDYLSGKYGAIPILNSFDIRGEKKR